MILQNRFFLNRDRDETAVRNYYRALGAVEQLPASSTLHEADISRLHSLVTEGRVNTVSYRDGPDALRDNASGTIVFIPAEAADIPLLMGELVHWINAAVNTAVLPVPVIAAIAHYRFTSIHPYFGQNGKTARLLALVVLRQHGYGLKGVYSLEEPYAADPMNYYNALFAGEQEQYYFGKADADISPFIEYFCESMAAVVESAVRSLSVSDEAKSDLRGLNARQRKVLKLLREYAEISSKQIADCLSIDERAARELAKRWADKGMLVVVNPSKRARTYGLSKALLHLLEEQGGN